MFGLSIEGSVAQILLSRPEARNAMPVEQWDVLASTAERAVGDGARALILAGSAAGVFCAGADVSDFGRFRSSREARTEFRLAIRNGLDRLRDLPVPTIALVEGACYGAGVALAMACDVRIAGLGARFAITPAKLGISYPQEDVHRLVSLVGSGQAARLLLSAATIDGAEAARIGLAELYARSGAAEAAAGLAEAIAANDSDSLRTLKRAVGLAAAGVRQDEAQDRAFDELLGSEALGLRLEAYRGRSR
ncbi:MAG TPA: enoyl-CoA hydratase/isomerase family protein [Allosphingosinicella sp.]|jgi:enoyl-CoA hydratase/carnithine racemase